MRLTLLVPALLSSLVLAAPSLSFFEQTPISVDGALSVPGENPLSFCHEPKDDILTIKRVDLFPNPPVPGSPLVIKATGTFHKDVEAGAKVFIQIKYGLITLIKQEADLCDQIQNVDMECPLEKGDMTLTKEVDLPNEIPPGTYNVFADVYTKDHDAITCLQATVKFSMGG